MPSKIYKAKLPLALGYIFHLTESILAHSYEASLWNFWHCLIVMTFRLRAPFQFDSFQHDGEDFSIVMRPCLQMYFTRVSQK